MQEVSATPSENDTIDSNIFVVTTIMHDNNWESFLD